MTGSLVNREELQKWDWRLGISSIEYNKSIETLAVGDSYVTNGQPWVHSLNDRERERERNWEFLQGMRWQVCSLSVTLSNVGLCVCVCVSASGVKIIITSLKESVHSKALSCPVCHCIYKVSNTSPTIAFEWQLNILVHRQENWKPCLRKILNYFIHFSISYPVGSCLQLFQAVTTGL